MTEDQFMEAFFDLFERLPEEWTAADDPDYNLARLAVLVAGLVVDRRDPTLAAGLEATLSDFVKRYEPALVHDPEDN